MHFLPLCFDLKKRTVLLVGGGEIALRKARLLLKAGAHLKVIADVVQEDLERLVISTSGLIEKRTFISSDVEGAVLVVGATEDDEVNAAVSMAARRAGVPVNVVDMPALSDFVFPALVERSPLVIAVSSGGASPVLARLLRARIESMIPNAFGLLADLVGRARGLVKERLIEVTQRRRFWEKTLEGPVAELVFAGKMEEAELALQTALDAEHDANVPHGEVYLVGAGPGDPDLLTFRALRLMQQADVVLYDRLVSNEVMELVRRDAERIYVGKARANHAVPQDQINTLILNLALQGKRVLRLKGGDPFIFGRGGEEIELLAEHRVPFQVVPGITAAAGCSCYAGIPLTHRDYAQSVRFVTGHLKDDSSDLDWSQFRNTSETIVFYMGLSGLAAITEGLIGCGRPTDTPVALVQQGTTVNQKVYTGTLASICDVVNQNGVKAPTLIIVGDVVKLHDQLKWFNT